MNVSTLAADSAGRPPHIDTEEWALRIKLAQCYRVFDHLGWTQIIFNHITARVPGPDHHFLINPFGLRYDEVTASNLVKIDLHGEPVGDRDHDVNPAGFIIHAAVHEQVPQALWIMHTHTPAGIAVACKAHGLSNTNFYSAMLFEHLAYHDFEGLTVRDDEQARLVRSIGDKPIVILRNHGLLVHGRTAEEAFQRMWTLQQACETQVQSESMAGPDLPVGAAATAHSTRDAGLFANEPCAIGVDSFNALVRIVDARDPSYRQ